MCAVRQKMLNHQPCVLQTGILLTQDTLVPAWELDAHCSRMHPGVIYNGSRMCVMYAITTSGVQQMHAQQPCMLLCSDAVLMLQQ